MISMTETFSELLKRLRTKSRLSLSQAARQVGISKPHLWDMESGRSNNPTAKTLHALSEAYNTSAATLLRSAIASTENARV